MTYPYEDLSDSQFESLVIQAARLTLGKGVQGFAKGVDGGRDARFEGTADGFPSRTKPWTGITVIQAKHTTSHGYFSDPAFSGTSESSVLALELARVRKLASNGQLDNYMLYSNRALTGNSNEEIVARIACDVGISTEKVHLCGKESLDEAFREQPRLADLAGISPLDGPLIVTSRQLAEVVEAISASLDGDSIEGGRRPQHRTTLAVKNELNSMTEQYSSRLMLRYGSVLRQIKEFLAEPGNSRIRDIYDGCALDFDLKIVAYRQDYQTFDRVFEYLVDLLVSRDTVLARDKRITRAVVFYMYWNCDIGETEERHAISEQA